METESKVTLKVQCKSCAGTGLYQGMAEKNGVAVICHTCRGTGGVMETYELFQGRVPRVGVTRVFKDSCGYQHSDKDVLNSKGVLIEFSKGGCSYEEWLNGAEPKPIKDLYCPYLWENQSMQNTDHPKWEMYRNRCSRGISLGGRITECVCYERKDQCWRIYEE